GRIRPDGRPDRPENRRSRLGREHLPHSRTPRRQRASQSDECGRSCKSDVRGTVTDKKCNRRGAEDAEKSAEVSLREHFLGVFLGALCASAVAFDLTSKECKTCSSQAISVGRTAGWRFLIGGSRRFSRRSRRTPAATASSRSSKNSLPRRRRML